MTTMPINGDEEDFLFADEIEEEATSAPSVVATPWKILIVDDDPEVHAITRVVLGDVVYDGRPLKFLSAHSGAEARDMVVQHADLATILLDVVMETDDAGLQLVHFIRETHGNRQVRIILRTGQPGQAPERQVIINYDINDYKAKNELTAQKLFTATIAALRSYQHIATIEQSQRGLERIVEASTELFEEHTFPLFARTVLAQLTDLLPGDLETGQTGLLLCQIRGVEAEVVAASGRFAEAVGRPVRDILPAAALADIDQAFREGCSLHRHQDSVVVFRARSQAPSVAYVAGHDPINDVDRRLIQIFAAKAAVGFDNVHLYDQINKAQQATVYALGKLAEFKDEVTGDHVRRVEHLTSLIAHAMLRRGHYPDEITEELVALIGLASILHDVGKVVIPDSVLRKPGKLTPEETTLMREHARIGATILREVSEMVAGRSYLSLGADIADSHHEKFDGSGYPLGLYGLRIPVAGRIVAVADVFDALMHKRPYKEPWELESVIDYIKQESGHHFDPLVVDTFLQVIQDNPSVVPALAGAQAQANARPY